MNTNQFGRQVPVPSFKPTPLVDAATPNDSTTGNGSTEPSVIAPPVQSDTAIAPPVRAYTPLLPDLSMYDLTVGEALDVFLDERRKRPSIRSLQRYCQEGRFDCFKLKTTRNGNPVHEWIIDSTSLRAFIQTKPEETATGAPATPDENGDVTPAPKSMTSVDNVAIATAPPERVDDAKEDLVHPRTPEGRPDVMATPVAADDASPEKRSLVELMIENAGLTARLDSQEDLIGELREDKKFMREQIVHQRGNDTLMADMHRETLHTLKAVSVAGRHTKIEMPDAAPTGEKGSAFYEAQDSEQRPQNDGLGGV
jgi:hypothetical protein